ncbi:hypothetical protein CDV55_100492 [Aspergillus turcosus]|nr:hypothetical protein CDV55_100492 [Aspergillus turcosus]
MLERVDSFLKTMLERVRPAMPYTNKSALIIGGSHGIGLSTAHLFINAGYTPLEPFADVSEASFRRTFDTNVFGAFFVAQKLATMVRPGGATVFTNLCCEPDGHPRDELYASSKAAVHSFVQTLAAEVVGLQVRVNAVSSGFVKTPIMGVVGASKEQLVEFEGQGVKRMPLPKKSGPHDLVGKQS